MQPSSFNRRTLLGVFSGGLAVAGIPALSAASNHGEFSYGDTVSGVTPDTWTFSASEGDTISIDVRIDNPFDNEVVVELFQPNGERVRSSTGNAEDGNAAITQHDVDRGRGGEYTIELTAGFASGTDSFGYSLSLYEGIPVDEDIKYGDTIESELTRSNRYYDDFSFSGYHETYSFTADEGDEVTIEMRPKNEVDDDAQLRLYDARGEQVASDVAQSGEDGNAVITLHEIERDQGGEYTIVATSDNKTDLFEYELFLYEGIPIDEEIAYGDSLKSELTRSNRYYDDFRIQGYHETYSFTADEGDEVTIEMRPKNEVDDDAQLGLYDARGEQVAIDVAQSGEDGNAVITLHEIGRDQGGEYTIIATGDDFTDLFEYELFLYEGIPVDEEIAYGDSVEGELTRSSRYYDDFRIQGYHETYSFMAEEGDEVTIEMRPDNETEDDARLALYDANGDEVENDIGQSGEDGNTVITLHEIEQNGEYTIVATGNRFTDLFKYELFLYEGIPIDEEIAYGDSVEGELTRSNRYYDDFTIRGYHETYSFAALGDNVVSIEMQPENKTEDDAQLALFDADGTEVTSDTLQNGDEGTALISEEELASEGTYTIVATGNNFTDVFSYTLTLTLDAGTMPTDEHPSGVSQEVWDAVTAQHDPSGELTFDDIIGAIQSYQANEPVNGVTLSFQDVVDLIEWYQD